MPPPNRSRRFAALLCALLALAIVGASRVGSGPAILLPPPSVEPGTTVLLAMGDVSSCTQTADDAVAALAASLPGTIALLGDIAYPVGSKADFTNCFRPSWGPMLPRIRPAPGNHEYEQVGADPYFAEFGSAAGTPGEGWYSYELGTWHVVVLNSNCDLIVGCGPGSPQLAWLEADLAATSARCTLAYWHHPRFSSGRHGDSEFMDPPWDALASAGADLVLMSHDHDYERFGPIDGMRSFVVGTGGRSHYEMLRFPHVASELRANDSYGLLMLSLHPDGYDWRFIAVAGGGLADAGSDACR